MPISIFVLNGKVFPLLSRFITSGYGDVDFGPVLGFIDFRFAYLESHHFSSKTQKNDVKQHIFSYYPWPFRKVWLFLPLPQHYTEFMTERRAVDFQEGIQRKNRIHHLHISLGEELPGLRHKKYEKKVYDKTFFDNSISPARMRPYYDRYPDNEQKALRHYRHNIQLAEAILAYEVVEKVAGGKGPANRQDMKSFFARFIINQRSKADYPNIFYLKRIITP